MEAAITTYLQAQGLTETLACFQRELAARHQQPQQSRQSRLAPPLLLNLLENDVLIQITEALPAEDLHRVALTCRRFWEMWPMWHILKRALVQLRECTTEELYWVGAQQHHWVMILLPLRLARLGWICCGRCGRYSSPWSSS
jgi:hypothetical protein